MNQLKLPLLKITLFACLLSSQVDLGAQCEGLKVILKMDDVRANSNSTYNSSWQRLADTIRAYNVNAAMGAVLVDLTKGSKAFKDSLKSWHESEYFEIWHHGWTHTRSDYPPNYSNAGEFSGTPYEYQKAHFEDGMKYAQSELGITLRTFGAPYNQTDITFSRVIEENPDMKVWLYCGDASYSEMCLFRGSNNKLESSTGVVSFESFMTAYESNTNPYLVLQGHPGQWSTSSFEQFEMVIDFLKEEDACFVLPYDYYKQEVNNPLLYAQKFDNPDSLSLNGGLDKVEASQTCCEELKIQMKSGKTLAMDEPIIHKIQVNGAINTVDIGETTEVYVRVRSEMAMDLRLDLSDGSSATDGASGKLVRSIAGNTSDWTLLVYDFPLSSYEETGLNTRQISEIHLYPSPTVDNFDGTLYIDYIAIGEEIEELAKCRSDIDRDGCVSLFEDQFDDEKVNLFGDIFDAVDILESGCGELVLSMKADATLPKTQAIQYQFPEALDFTENPKLVIQLRSTARMDMRVDLTDGSNTTQGDNGKITKSVPSNSYKWTALEYNYPQLAFAENDVDSTAITGAWIYIDPNKDNFSGTLYVDFLSAGKPTGVGNAIGKTEVDLCGVMEDPEPLGHIANLKNDPLIHPNPMGDLLTITSTHEWADSQLTVLNLSGKKILTTQLLLSNGEYLFDTSSLNAGIYFLVIHNGHKTLTKRVLKY